MSRSRLLPPLFAVPEGCCVDTCCLRALLREERWTAGGSRALHLRSETQLSQPGGQYICEARLGLAVSIWGDWKCKPRTFGTAALCKELQDQTLGARGGPLAMQVLPQWTMSSLQAHRFVRYLQSSRRWQCHASRWCSGPSSMGGWGHCPENMPISIRHHRRHDGSRLTTGDQG